MVEGVNSERVGVCLETGHANVFKYNMSKMARAFGDRLIALHVHGNAGGDSHVIPYSISGWTEQMNYHEFSETLKEIGFKGYYNLELGPGNLPRGCAQPYLELAAVVARAMADLAE